jgi:hypothetical protein
VAVTAKDIKDCFGEFAGTSDQLVDKFRLQAERRVNLTQWGEKADDAILWLTAHLLKLEKQIRGGNFAAAGPVSMRKTGDLTTSYKVPEKLGNSFLASTTYGQYFLDLKTGIWPERVLGNDVTVISS